MMNQILNGHPAVLDSWNPTVDQLAISHDLLDEVVKSGDHITLKFTPVGAVAFAKAWHEKEMESRLQPIEQEDEYLSKQDITEKLNISLSTVCNWQKRGYLTPVKIGHRVYFRKSDVDDLLQAK